MEIFENKLEEIMEMILDNKDEIEKRQLENEELKEKAMKILDDNFIMNYTNEAGTARISLMNYTKDLVNKEKVVDLIQDLKMGKKEVDELKLSDTTKETKVKFVVVKVID